MHMYKAAKRAMLLAVPCALALILIYRHQVLAAQARALRMEFSIHESHASGMHPTTDERPRAWW